MTKVAIKNTIIKILMLSCCLWLLTCQPKANGTLLIATAANMQFAMGEITRSFTEETGIACEMIVSSSGTLTAQIKEGAPFDIFVSANMMYPNELFNNGFTDAAPQIYAYGRLVIWSLVRGVKPGVALCTRPEVKHVAIANPKTAPYGIAAVEVLKYYNVFDSVKSKLVYGESIAQTNQFIVSKAAELGITAKSVVLSPDMKDRGQWKELDPGTYTPIAQGAVVLPGGENTGNAQKFYAFLFSEEGKKKLVKFGYAVND